MVIDWPFILTRYLAYPCWISWSIDSVKVAIIIYDTLYHSASLRISRYPGILRSEVLHRWFCALAEYLFRLSIRDTNSVHLLGGLYGNWNHMLNKCVISLLGLIFVSYLVSTYVRTLQYRTCSIPYLVQDCATSDISWPRVWHSRKRKKGREVTRKLGTGREGSWSLLYRMRSQLLHLLMKKITISHLILVLILSVSDHWSVMLWMWSVKCVLKSSNFKV